MAQSPAPDGRSPAWLVPAAVAAFALLGVAGWLLWSTRPAGAPAAPAATAVAAVATAPAAAAGSPAAATIDPARLANRLMDVEWLETEIVATYPHSVTAFTQGLLLHDGRFYESTGQKGASSLREVDPTSGEVLRLRANDPNVFAEGLALVGERLVQLTWMDQKAYVYDRSTFDLLAEHAYEGQGWGLCHDGARLVMSDGSDRLTFRDPETFAVTGEPTYVTQRGKAVAQLNELECVDGQVWANIWQSDTIVGIDPATGNVFANVDASEVARDARVTSPDDIDVLNGIAHDPATGHWFLTGKYWPRMYEVRFVPRGAAQAAP